MSELLVSELDERVRLISPTKSLTISFVSNRAGGPSSIRHMIDKESSRASEQQMSLRYVNAFAPELPYTLREQVLDYARSVEAASRDISKEAEIELTDELLDQLVLVAAVRKLHAICSSSYWLLYNSTKLLGDEVTGVRVGGTTFSRGSAHFDQLATLLGDLEAVLRDQGLSIEILRQPYPEILSFLANERS